MLFGAFGAQEAPKALKKHSLGHSEPGAQNRSKSLSGSTFRPNPLSPPVNGGWNGNDKTFPHLL